MQYFVSCAKNAGSYHINNNIPCQDCVDAKESEHKAIAIVSDGAGSKLYAKETAEILVSAIINLFDKNLLDKYIEYDLLYNYLNEKIRNTDLLVEDMAATLVFVYVVDDNYYCGHMGDGGIILMQNKNAFLLSAPENGEYLNETFFFPTSDKSHFRIKSGKVTEKMTFILSSDGAFDLLFDTDTQQAMDACNTMKEWNIYEADSNELIEYSLKAVLSKHSSDDQSIAVLSVE